MPQRPSRQWPIATRIVSHQFLNSLTFLQDGQPEHVDKIHTINYNGITVRVYEVVAHKKELLLSVGITSNRPGVLPELVGKNEGEIKAILGTPFQTRGQEWDFKTIYQDEPGEDILSLKFGNGRVVSAEWNFYVD